MPRVLYDINPLVYYKARTKGFEVECARAFSLAATGKVKGLVSLAHLPTLYYLIGGRRQSSTRKIGAKRDVRELLEKLVVAANTTHAAERALDDAHPIADFEDALLYETAREAQADAICTVDGSFLGVYAAGTLELDVLTPRDAYARFR